MRKITLLSSRGGGYGPLICTGRHLIVADEFRGLKRKKEVKVL